MRIYGIAIVLAAALAAAVSCTRDGDAVRGGERRELAIDVRMQSSDWTPRASAAQARMAQAQAAQQARCAHGASGARTANSASRASAPMSLDERLEIVAECEPIGYTPDAPLTRGTPLGSASELKTLSFAVYTNSLFTKNCTATYAGGSWSVSNNMTVDVDKNKYSYYAYAPTVTADNGIVAAADGQTLTYTAPADITKQPDLCRATPITDDNTGKVNFTMQHALTAVGVKVRASNVTIKSIKLTKVNTSGKLNLTNGAWSGVGTPLDLAFALINTRPSTGDGMPLIIASNGYLMLPPQALSGDNQNLTIIYQYDGEAEKTSSHKLSDITGGNWAAGQKINYVIQLKSNFSLTLNPAAATVPYEAGSYTFGYSTGSSASSDPKVSYDASVVTGFVIDRVNHKISFNYYQNPSKGASRQTKIKVTSGFTTQDFTLTQDGLGVLINGTYWTKSNLTGNASTNTGHRLEVNPQDKGMFFKWGAIFVYGRITSVSEGEGFDDYDNTLGASTNGTVTGDMGYDYVDLYGSPYSGDPCQELGSDYKTPTRAQWKALYSSGFSKFTTYQGVKGHFFGPSAYYCNSSTIQPGCIFLPSAGHRNWYNGFFSSDGMYGFYWSSSVYSASFGMGYYCRAYDNTDVLINPESTYRRSEAMSVRCVYVP